MGTIPIGALAVATLAGLAVGIERQWSGHASGDNARFGGLRTFTMIGLASGIAGWWMSTGLTGPAVVILAGLVAVIVIAYFAAARHDVDATTEVAGLVVVVAGVLAGMGQATLASAVTAITVLLLVEKSRLHGLVERLGEVELLAAARFAVMAAVILPLLPAEPLGPFGPLGEIRIRQLWALVLFFSGLSFAGYLARRVFGANRGYAVAGALGGLVSSTSVTLTFSRLSREHPESGRMLAAGVMGANVMLFPRVLLATAVLAPSMASALWPAFLAPVAIGLLLLARGVSQHPESTSAAEGPQNPLQIGAALQMAVLFQVVLFLVSMAESWFGSAGLYASAAVLGLTDVDALTVSMSQRATTGTAVDIVAPALALGILSNTLVKTAIAFVVGRGVFRRLAAAGLFVMALAIGAWLALTLFP
jgi:uncharacterized membrane protein (DUF4010 family)